MNAFKRWRLNRAKGILNDEQIELLCINHCDDLADSLMWRSMITPFLKEKIRLSDLGNPIISCGLSSMGYDMRLGSELLVFSGTGPIVDPKDQSTFEMKKAKPTKEGYFIIPPNGYALGVSVEYFCIPDNVMALCMGKSTYARSGIDVNLTPLEPGWEGHLTLEIANHLPVPTAIYPGEGIAQVIFIRGNKSKKPYGQGKYQAQGPQPIKSRM